MQSFPAPPVVTRHPFALGALAVALVVAAAVALVMSGSSSAPAPAPQSDAAAYNGLIGGVPLQQARCVQWNAGSEAERNKVVGALAYSVGGATAYGRGNTLPLAEAHALFARACSNQIAQHWLLYELYIRAAGFRSPVPR